MRRTHRGSQGCICRMMRTETKPVVAIQRQSALAQDAGNTGGEKVEWL